MEAPSGTSLRRPPALRAVAPHASRPAAATRALRGIGVLALVALLTAACGKEDGGSATSSEPSGTRSEESAPRGGATEEPEELYPDVVAVEVSPLGEGTYEVAATLSSPYDTPERYADAWRVLDPEGNELGVRELAHDHAGEQPFTRRTEVEIPDDVDEVTVEGRDQLSGWGGDTVSEAVPR